MMRQFVQDIGLWEVWIEYDQFDPENFGTLYVIGEAIIAPSCNGQLIHKISGGKDKRRLMLEVPSQSGRGRTKEVLYSERIKTIDQYTTVFVFAGEQLIASFDDIEVMI